MRKVFLLLIAAQLAGAPALAEELAAFSMDSLEILHALAKKDANIEVSLDGGATRVRCKSDKPVSVSLIEVPLPPLEDTVLEYRARLRSEDVANIAYLEMWCVFGEKEAYFSRDLDQPLTGTQTWVRRATPFFLEADRQPQKVLLGLRFEGPGTVWIDDVRLTRMDRSL